MNEIITLETLAARLAQRAGITADMARQYIGMIKQDVAEQLSAGANESVVPHFGSFSVDNQADGSISFTPVEEIADIVNEPFSFFESVPLADDAVVIPDDVTATITGNDVIDKTATTDDSITVDTEPSTVDTTTDTPLPDESAPIYETAEEDFFAAANYNEATDSEESQPEEETRVDYPEEEEEHHHRGMNPIVAYISGILTGMILTCVAVYFLYPPLHTDDSAPYTDETEISEFPTDETTGPSVQEQPLNPEPDNMSPAANTAEPTDKNDTKTVSAPLTDTVGPNHYLATMSRKYYGRMEFWVYIYKENQNKLGHPDRIPVGTVVTIPPASKYDIDPNSQQSIDKARNIATELLGRYK